MKAKLWPIIVIFLLMTFASGASARSVDLGIDEVLLVDGQVVTFDAANGGAMILLHVETENASYSPIMRFGDNLTGGGVTYTVGSFDPQGLKLKLHLSGNWSSLRVMKKYDLDADVVEAFDTYVKLNVTSTGFYPLNGTLKVYSQGVLLEERQINLSAGRSMLLKLRPMGGPITLSMEKLGISKTVVPGEIESQVSIERVWSNGTPVVELLNRGDPVNAAIKLLYGGLMVESRRVVLPKGESEVSFTQEVAQGTVVVDYGGIAQESFYFKPPVLVLEDVRKNGSMLTVSLRNTGEVSFRGTVSVLQNGVIVGKPLSRDIWIGPGKEEEVAFVIPSDAVYLTVAATSGAGSFSFPIRVGAERIQVEAQSESIRVPLGGKGTYILTFKGSGRASLGVSGLPDSIHYAFYLGDAEVRDLNVDGVAQATLLLTVPSLPAGFSVGEPLRFNVTVSTGNETIDVPLELEVYGLGLLPVYGDNWLAKMNYTSERHFVGIPYRFAGRDLTPPLAFEEWNGSKIAIAYGDYVQRGLDLTIHVLSSSGKILYSSKGRKGTASYVVFGESDFMLMLEGEGFSGVLLVADYLDGSENVSFELKPKDFGTGVRTFIINATEIRGQRLRLNVSSDKPVEVRAYYFTLNDERKDFDPLSADFKGVFRGKGTSIGGSINIRSYEDFVAVSVIGTGNVSIMMFSEEVPVHVSGLGKYTAYLVVAGLLALLGAVVYLERRLG